MAKADKKESNVVLSYVWSILMFLCIALLLGHLIQSTDTTVQDNTSIISKTFTQK